MNASSTVSGYSTDLEKLVYQSGFTVLESCWKKCVELNEDYLKKQIKINPKKSGVLIQARDFFYPILVKRKTTVNRNGRATKGLEELREKLETYYNRRQDARNARWSSPTSTKEKRNICTHTRKVNKGQGVEPPQGTCNGQSHCTLVAR